MQSVCGYILTDEVVAASGVVLGNVGNGLERLEEDRESLAMSRVAAVEHHHRLTVVVDVTVQVLGTTHLYYRSRDNCRHRAPTNKYHGYKTAVSKKQVRAVVEREISNIFEYLCIR